MNDGAPARLADETRTLGVWLSSMSERTRALLEFHFDHDARRSFELAASAATADVVIVDHDYPGARAALEDGRWRDGPPLVLLAHGGAQGVSGALVLDKPLHRAGLDALAVRLRAGPPYGAPEHAPYGPATTASASSPGARPEPRPADDGGGATDVTDPVDAEAASAISEPPMLERRDGRRGTSDPGRDGAGAALRERRARSRVNALCGPPRSLSELADKVDATHRYDPTRHLSGHLARAIDGFGASGRSGAGARGLMLVLPDIELYVLPWLDRICISEPLTWQVGVDRAFRELDDADVTVVPYRSGTVNALVARVNAGACQAFPIAAFRWLAALFSARGRLPFGVDVEAPYRLAHWPNLSRLEMTPDCMDIVAEWTTRPASIATLVERVGCEPRHVTSLHAAASECGLLRPDDEPPVAVAGDDPFTDDGDDDATT